MDVQGGSFHRALTYQVHYELCDYSRFHVQFNYFPPSYTVIPSSYSNYLLSPRDIHQPPCVVGMWRLGMNGEGRVPYFHVLLCYTHRREQHPTRELCPGAPDTAN